MTDVETESAITMHGDIEYEVARCVSCSQEHRPESMTKLFTGVVREVDTEWSYKDEVAFKSGTLDTLYFCEHCYDDPIRVDVPFEVSSTMVKAVAALVFAVGMVCGVGVMAI